MGRTHGGVQGHRARVALSRLQQGPSQTDGFSRKIDSQSISNPPTFTRWWLSSAFSRAFAKVSVFCARPYQPVAQARLVQILGLRAWQIPFKRSQSRQIGPFGPSNWPIRPVKTVALAPCRKPSSFATGSYGRPARKPDTKGLLCWCYARCVKRPRQSKYPRGRPVKCAMPECIPDTLENVVMRALEGSLKRRGSPSMNQVEGRATVNALGYGLSRQHS